MIFLVNLSLRFIFRIRRFHEDFLLKERPCAFPSLFYKHAWHNLGKALGKGLGLLCALFTSLSLSPLYPSLSLSLPPSPSLSIPLYPSLPFSLSFSPSLSFSLLSLSPSLSISLLLPFFHSLSFSLSSLYHSLWRI